MLPTSSGPPRQLSRLHHLYILCNHIYMYMYVITCVLVHHYGRVIYVTPASSLQMPPSLHVQYHLLCLL